MIHESYTIFFFLVLPTYLHSSKSIFEFCAESRGRCVCVECLLRCRVGACSHAPPALAAARCVRLFKLYGRVYSKRLQRTAVLRESYTCIYYTTVSSFFSLYVCFHFNFLLSSTVSSFYLYLLTRKSIFEFCAESRGRSGACSHAQHGTSTHTPAVATNSRPSAPQSPARSKAA